MRLLGIGWCTVLMAMALAACGPGQGDDDPAATDGPSAREMKQQVDEAVLEVLPALASGTGVAAEAARATFSTCQVSTQWRYVARTSVHGLTGDLARDGETISGVLEQAGFQEVEVDDDGDVTARRDLVEAYFGPAVPGKTFRNASFTADCTDLDSEGEAFAEADEGTDYPDLR